MITNFAYLLSLVVSISCLLLIDYRYKLAFWNQPKAAAYTILTSMLVFIIWDGLGIGLGIFYKGSSQFVLPFTIAPEFPLEELFFLFLLTFVTLIIHNGLKKWRRI